MGGKLGVVDGISIPTPMHVRERKRIAQERTLSKTLCRVVRHKRYLPEREAHVASRVTSAKSVRTYVVIRNIRDCLLSFR